MIDLKPCPFCGGEAEMNEVDGFFDVWCPKCSIVTLRIFYSKKDAAAAWNRRAGRRAGNAEGDDG